MSGKDYVVVAPLRAGRSVDTIGCLPTTRRSERHLKRSNRAEPRRGVHVKAKEIGTLLLQERAVHQPPSDLEVIRSGLSWHAQPPRYLSHLSSTSPILSSPSPIISLCFSLGEPGFYSEEKNKGIMWRSSSTSRLLFRTLLGGSFKQVRCGCAAHQARPWSHLFSTSASPSPPLPTSPPTFSSSPPPPPPHPPAGAAPEVGCDGAGAAAARGGADVLSFSEAKRLLRLVNVEALKRKLGTENEEVIGYAELLEACVAMGVARSREEAAAFARVLDDAGVILLFRDKVYLHPHKVVDLMKKAVPLALTPEDDPRREELKHLIKKKEEIDTLAHKQVRCILWSGLGFLIVQVGLFFRLTFWEFSWDVMEPIAFFTTTTGLLVGYAYFLFTSRDPTYQDLMKRLFLSRQKRLCQKHNFDANRFMELQKYCRCPLDEKRGLNALEFLRD